MTSRSCGGTMKSNGGPQERSMLPLNDPRWKALHGGYRTPYDASVALARLERGEDVWEELWQELHHQGDVGDASYASVPHLVRICSALPERDSNLYELVSTIEVERHRRSNPQVPEWLWRDFQRRRVGDRRVARRTGSLVRSLCVRHRAVWRLRSPVAAHAPESFWSP